jgi:hypothetical protein
MPTSELVRFGFKNLTEEEKNKIEHFLLQLVSFHIHQRFTSLLS